MVHHPQYHWRDASPLTVTDGKTFRDLRVLLVCMPWAAPVMPSLGLSILKGVLASRGVACTVLYANLTTLAAVPRADVLTLGESPLASLLYSAFLDDSCNWDSVIDAILSNTCESATIDGLQGDVWTSASGLYQLLGILQDELDTLADHIHAADWDVVGFTVVFEQTIPSLALARRLKNRTDVITVLGGASCEGDMGPGLLDAFPFVDYTISGEADTAIIQFLQALTGDISLASVPGLSFRSRGRVVQNAYRPVTSLNQLPLPDYADYFSQAERSRFRYVLSKPVVPFELSRGCWWGQKHLCSFCGLNGTTLEFRRKEPARVLDEIAKLSEKHRVQEFHAADNILDMRYFQDVLPALAAQRARGDAAFTFFFEVKSNLKRDNVKMLADAGVRFIQPGIESFSDHILALMNKGATGIQQVQLLKWCDDYRIKSTWNIITHNPGERAADYDEMAALIPFIRHLSPPTSVVRMQLQRFSPHFLYPERYGITNVRPSAERARIYGLDLKAFSRIAYEFDFDCAGLADELLDKARERTLVSIRDWMQNFRAGTLTYSRGAGFVRIIDQRHMDGHARITILSGQKAALFSYFDECHSLSAACRHFQASSPLSVRCELDEMVERKIMWRDHKERYISLPVRRDHQE